MNHLSPPLVVEWSPLITMASVNLVMVASNLKALPKEFLSVDILCSGKVLACAPFLYPGFSIGGGPHVIMTSLYVIGTGILSP